MIEVHGVQLHPMDLNQVVTLSPDVISQEVSGETVLLDLNSEHYFGLDEVGTRIWQLIDSSGNLQEIYDTMLNEYEVEASTSYSLSIVSYISCRLPEESISCQIRVPTSSSPK